MCLIMIYKKKVAWRKEEKTMDPTNERKQIFHLTTNALLFLYIPPIILSLSLYYKLIIYNFTQVERIHIYII